MLNIEADVKFAEESQDKDEGQNQNENEDVGEDGVEDEVADKNEDGVGAENCVTQARKGWDSVS